MKSPIRIVLRTENALKANRGCSVTMVAIEQVQGGRVDRQLGIYRHLWPFSELQPSSCPTTVRTWPVRQIGPVNTGSASCVPTTKLKKRWSQLRTVPNKSQLNTTRFAKRAGTDRWHSVIETNTIIPRPWEALYSNVPISPLGFSSRRTYCLYLFRFASDTRRSKTVLLPTPLLLRVTYFR